MLCDFKTFHTDVDHLKTILRKYNYRLKFVNLSIKSFLDNFLLYTLKATAQNVHKMNVFIGLPLLVSTVR